MLLRYLAWEYCNSVLSVFVLPSISAGILYLLLDAVGH